MIVKIEIHESKIGALTNMLDEGLKQIGLRGAADAAYIVQQVERAYEEAMANEEAAATDVILEEPSVNDETNND